MSDPLYDRLVFRVLLAVIVTQAIFAAFPGIDLAVSRFFADGAAGFPWANGLPAALNLVLRRLGEMVAFALVLWFVLGGLAGQMRGDELRAWGFAALAVGATSAIVNLGLKANVGRARPASIAEFGGGAEFTPAWQVVDHCARNCSFTSGEVALASSLATVALVLFWPQLKRARACFRATAAAVAYVGIVALLRIGLGRHFLSDAIFSVLLSGAVTLVLYRLLRVSRARLAFDPGFPVMIAMRQFEDLRARARAWLKRAT